MPPLILRSTEADADTPVMAEKFSVRALARELLDRAHRATNGRSAETIYGGHEHQLRQTLLALVAGTSLAEHDSPGEATLFVVSGRVRLSTSATSWEGIAGDMLVVPGTRHGLHALEDCAVILTVVKAA